MAEDTKVLRGIKMVSESSFSHDGEEYTGTYTQKLFELNEDGTWGEGFGYTITESHESFKIINDMMRVAQQEVQNKLEADMQKIGLALEGVEEELEEEETEE